MSWLSGKKAVAKKITALVFVPLLAFLVFASVIATQPKAAGWAAYNYTGYETKPHWGTYMEMMDYIKSKPPGRWMVEQDHDNLNKLGTTRAFELIPFWTESATMEGLLVEGAFTSVSVSYTHLMDILGSSFSEYSIIVTNLLFENLSLSLPPVVIAYTFMPLPTTSLIALRISLVFPLCDIAITRVSLFTHVGSSFEEEWKEYLGQKGFKSEEGFVSFLVKKGRKRAQAVNMIESNIYDSIMEDKKNLMVRYIADYNRNIKSPLTINRLKQAVFKKFIAPPPLDIDLSLIHISSPYLSHPDLSIVLQICF